MITTRKLTKWNDWQRIRARGRRVLKLRERELSWAEIGERIGVSRQRAAQIWKACVDGKGPYAGLL
jgi:DNA-directed RNA polymerase specialized sigma subunit